MRAQIKKNDTVMVIAGRDRGKTGRVLRIMPETRRALVERLNIVKRHTKEQGPQAPHGIVEKEAGIHLSNLMVLCDKCDAPVRIGKRILENDRRVRVCRRCGDQLDQ